MGSVKSLGDTGGLLVMKFGGTSVGNAEAIRRVVEIVGSARERYTQVVVVTSAMAGVTNLLLEGAQKASEGDDEAYLKAAQMLRRQHAEAARELLSDELRLAGILSAQETLIADFENLCHAIFVLGEATPRALDAVASLGERLAAPLISAALEEHGVASSAVSAVHFLVTDDNFQSAHPDMALTAPEAEKVIRPLLTAQKVPVVTGFVGRTRSGVISTLGRGGSDFSAAIVGAVLKASEVWIWTDVNGVMTADPRIVPRARTIPTLSFRELAELAYFGAKVLHPKTVRPVVEAGIGLRILNTFHPEHPGTRLVPKNEASGPGPVKAVTAIRGQQLITIEGRGMLGVPGVAARAFGAVAETGTNVILISQASSEQSITFAVASVAVPKVVASLERVFASELENRDIDRVWKSEEAVIITVVGAGMCHTPGIAGKVFSALGKEEVNVMAIAQGSSEVAISLVVGASEMEKAVNALHSLIE